MISKNGIGKKGVKFYEFVFLNCWVIKLSIGKFIEWDNWFSIRGVLWDI